jgi:hypothetical protein
MDHYGIALDEIRAHLELETVQHVLERTPSAKAA